MCDFRIQPEKPCRQLVPLACPHCSGRSFLLSDIMQCPGPDPGSAVFPRTLGFFSGSPFMLQLEGPATDTFGCDGAEGSSPTPSSRLSQASTPAGPRGPPLPPGGQGTCPGPPLRLSRGPCRLPRPCASPRCCCFFSGDLKSPAYLFCFKLIPCVALSNHLLPQ